MDRFEEIYANESYVDFSKLKVRRVNKTRAIIGEVEFKQLLGNDVLVDIKIYKKQGGEYRKMPYEILHQPFCDFYGNDIYIYHEVAKDSDLPADLKKNCPLKPVTFPQNFFSL